MLYLCLGTKYTCMHVARHLWQCHLLSRLSFVREALHQATSNCQPPMTKDDGQKHTFIGHVS